MTKENIKEQVVGSMPVKTAGSGNVRGSGVKTKLNPGKVTPQSQIRKIDPKQFDNRSAAVTTNTPSGGSLKAGSFGISQAGKQQAAANRAEFKAKADAVKSSSTTESKPVVSSTTKQGKPRTKAQMMAAKRIASGKSIQDVKDANIKSMQDRARAKNKEFQAAKKSGNLKQFRKDNPKVSGSDRAKLMAQARIEAQKKASEKPVENKKPGEMKSNFAGGVSGKGKATDDFSKDPRYQSTAGTSTDIKKPVRQIGRSAAKRRQMEEYSPYDIVLEYLLSTEQAATIEEANYVMMQLDEENIQEIVGTIAKTIMKTPLVKLVPAAIGTGIATKMIASKLGQKSVKPVTPPAVKTPTKDIQVGDGIDAKKSDESLMDYYKRRKKSLETQDKKLGAGEY